MLAWKWKMGWVENIGNDRPFEARLQTTATTPPRFDVDPHRFKRFQKLGNSGIYTVKYGHNAIQNNSRKEGIWKNVWNDDGLPKIFFFVGY